MILPRLFSTDPPPPRDVPTNDEHTPPPAPRPRASGAKAPLSARLLASTIETMQLGVTITDVTGHIIYTNPAEARMHGYTVEELIGQSARMLAPEGRAKPLSTEQMAGLTSWSREGLNRRKDGTLFPVVLRSDVVKNARGEVLGIVTCCEDVTQRRAMEKQLLESAFYDALTGLPNRGLFLHRLEAAGERARRSGASFAVLMLGIDSARLIYESLGHEAEDELLASVARRLHAAVRADTLLARVGTGDFALLIEEVNGLLSAAHLAQRLLQTLADPFTLHDRGIFCRATVGIALGSAPFERPDEVLRDATVAMYRGRDGGGGSYEVFDPAMHAEAVARLRLEADLRHALERGEIHVHYQPIVLLDSGRIAGFEALARWRHPELGEIPPDRFIPLAEETGLIVPLGMWVLRAACEQVARLQRDACGAHPLTVAVNLSVKQLAQPSLIPDIAAVLEETGVDPARLKLEITESVLMHHSEAVTSTLNQLRDLGIQLYIDDFGTGYSSLSYLHRLPLHALKIDRSFVADLHTPGGMQLVRAIIALAHALGVMVVTEGVESPELLAELRGLGCEFAQGYFFSQPLDAARVEELCDRDPRW